MGKGWVFFPLCQAFPLVLAAVLFLPIKGRADPPGFWGRVVDENGAAVPGAVIRCYTGEEEGAGEIHICRTTAKGDFSFRGTKAKTLRVEIDHSEFYRERSGRIPFNTPAARHLFILKPRGVPEALLAHEDYLSLNLGGEGIRYDLLVGSVKPKEFPGNADLRITGIGEGGTEGGKNPWTLVLEVEGGADGLLEIKDGAEFLAPRTGYGKRLVFKAGDFTGPPGPSYVYLFIKAAGGKRYARMRIEFSRARSGENEIHFGKIRICYLLNPTGSGNLEYEKGNMIAVKKDGAGKAELKYPDKQELKKKREELAARRKLGLAEEEGPEYFPFD